MSWHPSRHGQDLLRDERGTIRKEWGGRLPIALVFPNSYHVGMSSLALHTLYRHWNSPDDLVCERIFALAPRSGTHADAPPRALSLESGAPATHFPVVAFTLTYELDYWNVVMLLRTSGIPPRAADRDDGHPLILAGGPAISANPEPLAPVLDAIVVGEVEPILERLTDGLRCTRDGRDAALHALADIPGVYLPNYPPPPHGCLPLPPTTGPIVRQWLADLDTSPTHSILFTRHTEFPNMGLVEIARGCGRGCRFCLAGSAYRPPRERSLDNILAQAQDLLRHTDRIGLVSAAVSDHSHIDQIAVQLRRLGARISASSLRVDPVSEPLLRALAESGTRTLTIAPEAGSHRLRQVIHKTQTEDDVLRAVELASRCGMEQLKLYFMVGLPTEEEDDLRALVDLSRACASRFSRRVAVNITPFVPKAHTPFQREQQLSAGEISRRIAYLERGLRHSGIQVKSESPAWAEVQGTLSRGDRRTCEALLSADRLAPSTWAEALAHAGLVAGDILASRPAGTPLPWQFIRFGAHPPAPQAPTGDVGTSALPEPCHTTLR